MMMTIMPSMDDGCLTDVVRGIAKIPQSKKHSPPKSTAHKANNSVAAVVVGCIGGPLLITLLLLLLPWSVASLSFNKATSMGSNEQISALTSIDRAKFLSAAVGSGTALLLPQCSDGAQDPGDSSSLANTNPRYIEENLSMTYGYDKNGNPKSRGILVRRLTGDSTPYQFPVEPYTLTKEWPEDWPFKETDFFRSDSNDDGWFYKVPRLVYHIDEPAVASLTQYYRKSIPARSDVLDICSSWISHYPLEFPATMNTIRGIGMNGLELGFNPQLTGGYQTTDLNEDPRIPYPDNSFDAVTCVVSINYLTQPVEVLREVHRVLRPGGKMIVSQSNRCFPSKTVAMVGAVPRDLSANLLF